MSVMEQEEPKRGVGRPPLSTDETLDVQLKIRIYASEEEKLIAWCKKKKWSKTDAVREGLRKLGVFR
jgi:hypothetical protein